jgi:Protein of unknown function (DUF2750)
MRLNPKQIAAVVALPGPRRYANFVKVAADQRKVWGLHAEGWALASTDEGKEVFPLWPAEEYALQCAVGEWAKFRPEEIDLDTLFDVLIPKLKATGTLVGVFPTPEDKGVTPDLAQLEVDLRSELSRIE